MVNKPPVKEFWNSFSMPVLATDLVSQTTVGMYYLRLLRGIDLQGKEFFMLEVRNLFGFLDEFCMKHSNEHYGENKAKEAYRRACYEAKQEYKRLKAKAERRQRNG